MADLVYSESSGLDFLRLIRDNERWKETPFIFTSATHPTEQDIKEMKRLNVKRFILLPIDSDIFLTIIQNIYAGIGKNELAE
jgi:DNA-binding NarL/FixJ family response regulator